MFTRLSCPRRVFQQKGYIFIGNRRLFVKVYVWGTVHEVLIFMPKNTLLTEHDVKFIKDEHVYKNSHWYVLWVDPIDTTMDDALSQLFVRGYLRIKRCSNARWHLTRKQAKIASLDWCNGPFDAETIEDLLHDDICTLPVEAYRTYIKELDDEYYARCFAMHLCELDGYAGQPIVSGNIVVWGQNPAQNV